jgi:hypothetical protein
MQHVGNATHGTLTLACLDALAKVFEHGAAPGEADVAIQRAAGVQRAALHDAVNYRRQRRAEVCMAAIKTTDGLVLLKSLGGPTRMFADC